MVRVTLSKTTKVLIILVIALILGGTGGYLLWRINQEDTVAPTDSDAGGGNYGDCGSADCTCGTDNSCATTTDNTCLVSGKWETGCNCTRCQCANGVWVIGQDCAARCTACGNDTTAPAGECTVGSQCPACEWPQVAYCGNKKCGCILPGDIPSGQLPCGVIEACTPAACPTGWTNCGTSGDGLNKAGCTAKTSCTATCTVCANKSKIYRYCKQGSNTCDSGSWNSKPTGTYEYCEEVSYSALGTDSDGIDETSISVKLNNSAKATFDKTSTTTSTTITDDLSTSEDCLDPGSYTLDITWKDKKGATSTNCTLTTTFTVQEEDEPPPPGEPDWEITKVATEECLNEDTEEPTSVVSYVITVTNNALQEESMDKIVDVLDTKVLQAYLSNISTGGVYATGSITWELEGTDEVFASEQSKTYTYKISIPHTAFGSYTNTVTAYPKEGDSISDTANIAADCVITPDEQPQTGLFDSTISKLLLGIVMILVGFNLHRVSKIQLFFKKLGTSMSDVSDERRKRNFEKKIVKK